MGIDWNTTLAEVMEKGIELEVVELMLKIIMEKHEKELDEIMEKMLLYEQLKISTQGETRRLKHYARDMSDEVLSVLRKRGRTFQ